MKFKKVFFITIILLAILSFSAVSAEGNLTDNNMGANTPVSPSNENPLGTSNSNQSISSGDVVKYYKNATQYQATFYDSNGTTLAELLVPITINGTTVNGTTNQDGILTYNISFVPGEYSITVKNPITNETATNKITVLPTIIGSDIVKYFKNETQYLVTVLDDQGNPLANSTVIFTINGRNYTRTTNASGIAKMNINLVAGKHVVAAKSLRNNDTTFNFATVLPTISGNNVVKYYRNGTQYYVNVVDGQGNPLANSPVELNINGVKYKRATNENGTAKLNINLEAGKYIITAKNLANGEETSNNITVLKTINGTNVKLYYRNGTKYLVSAYDYQGNPLVNASIKLNINGVYYNRKTNENGTASLNINLDPGKFIITAENPLTGEKTSNVVEVVSRIIPKGAQPGADIALEFKNGKYTVELHEKNGTLAVNKTVTFNINGVMYTRASNSQGLASLNINLEPGDFIITANYDGCSVSNLLNVRITPSIKILTTTVKSGGNVEFRLTEKNSGLPITGNHYGIIYFNGTTYGTYPDSTGLCKIGVGLPAGNYLFYFGTIDDGRYSSIWVLNTIKVTN